MKAAGKGAHTDFERRSLTIQERRIGDVVLLDVKGAFLIGCRDPLVDKVKGLVAEGLNNIVLNLAGVTQCDGTTFGDVVRALVVVRKGGGDLKILAPSKPVRSVLERPRLAAVFEILEDEDQAVKSFR